MGKENEPKLLHSPKERMSVYRITHLSSGKHYIGSSVNTHARWRGHINDLKRGNHHNLLLQRSVDKYGLSAFEFAVMVYVYIEDEMLQLEQMLIDEFESANPKYGFNRSPSAGTTRGLRPSKETRRKQSKAKKGKKWSKKTRQTMMKIMTSDEHRAKLSDAHKGKPLSKKHCEGIKKKWQDPEYRQKQMEWRVGFQPSKESRKKAADKLRGRRRPDSIMLPAQNAIRGKRRSPDVTRKIKSKNQELWKVTSPKNDVFYVKGLAGFCRERGLHQGCMSNVNAGRAKTHRGWKCKKIDGKQKSKKFKHWKVTSPVGEVYYLDKLTDFCDENELSANCMYGVANGKHYHHRDWKCEKVYTTNISKGESN